MFQYIWRHSLWGGPECVLTDGRHIRIINPGRLNTDAGPDFSDARMECGGTVWAGNIELHIRASDWYRHGHDSDPAYDSVMLHVVSEADTEVFRRNGEPIPQLEIICPEVRRKNYEWLRSGPTLIRCRRYIPELPDLVLTDWLESLAVARLQRKAEDCIDTARNLGYHWQQTTFIRLARALGFGLNADPMETLARSLPLNTAARHSDRPDQLEALLFGQAGMLDSSANIFDSHYQDLCREYAFLARKYGLRPCRNAGWKLARTRPQNFPHSRIALLARHLEGGFSLLHDLVEAASAAAIDTRRVRDLLNPRLPEYWTSHYSFRAETGRRHTRLSDSSVDLLLINFAAPLLTAYGIWSGRPELEEASVELLASLAAESNRKTRLWEASGLVADNALQSQALIELHDRYCEPRRCLDCRWGYRLLSLATDVVSEPEV